jgi:hypothetical protein
MVFAGKKNSTTLFRKYDLEPKRDVTQRLQSVVMARERFVQYLHLGHRSPSGSVLAGVYITLSFQVLQK